MRSTFLASLALTALLAAPAFALTIEKDVTVNKKKCDLVTWTDAAGKSRSVALVHADGDVGKFSGGYVEQYKYFLGDKQVTAKSDENMPDVSGMGCAVDHHAKYSASKQNSTDATTAFILEGASHAVWRFKSLLHGPAGKDNHDCAVGLVIDYAVADGRSDVLWSVSYDTSKFKDKEIGWDARGPYFQFDWDGDGKFFGTKVSGIRWGDKYHFKTVQMDGKKSSWDYTKPNTIPYMMLYKEANLGDAECTVVQTLSWTEKPAGGYWWSSKNWGKTGQPMMENWNCPFQLNAYEDYASEKMAWGNPGGYVGSSSYDCLDFKTKGKGWPYAGYATLIVTGRHSDAPGDKTIAAMEAVQKTTLTASKGKIAEKLPGYVGLAELAPCTPLGWDSVYAQWAVECADSQAAVNFAVAEGSLAAATIAFTNFTAAKPTITLNGKDLQPGKDCYLTVDTANKRLLLTLAQPLTGATNTLTVK